MASLNHVSKRDVLKTLDLYDNLGGPAFHARFGYQNAKTWRLKVGGKTYPSKAILGVAARLLPSSFFGGVAQTVPKLRSLGFEVRGGERFPLADHLYACLGKTAGTFEGRPRFTVDPTSYFHSGSNRPGEIRGLAATGNDIGVVAPELLSSRESVDALLALKGTDVQVFVDSGAFSEVRFDTAANGCTGGWVTVKPITGEDWARIITLYQELARGLGSQLWVVAPDKVGDQDETLHRLEHWASQLRDIAAEGTRVLVPVQKGRRSQAGFWQVCKRVLGFAFEEQAIPALPCKKAATTPVEAAAFVALVAPAHVHMLGLGPNNRQAEDYAEAVQGGNTARCGGDHCQTTFSLDSNWIRANVGRTNGPGGGRRKYTEARDVAKSLLSDPTAGSVATLALLLALGGA